MGYSEVVIRRTANTWPKKRTKKPNNYPQHTTQKTKE